MRSIVYKNIRNYGSYDFDTGQITIQVGLQDRYNPSKKFVIEHENYHKYLDYNGLTIGGEEEEFLCDLWAVISCSHYDLSFGDELVNKRLRKKFGRISKAKLYKLRKEILKHI